MLVTGQIDRRLLDELRGADLGVGLHVNLTLGRPLTGGRSLVGPDGRLIRDARRAAGRAAVEDVEAEIEAQIEQFVRLIGRAPDHLDTHHHVGLLAPVADVVLSAARRLAVPLRSPNATARERARAAGLPTPDHFFGESGPGAYWTLPRTLVHLRRLSPGVTEFMTHPGWFDEDLAYSRYGRQRESEMVGLGTPAARAAAAALGIVLCRFADL